jgi:hypothetical protein
MIPAFAPRESVEGEKDGLGVVVGADGAIVVGVGVDVELILELVPATGFKLMPLLLSQQAVLLLPQQNMTASFGHGVTSTSSTLSFPS